MAAGVFDPVADGRPAGDSSVGPGFSRVENRVGLFVTELARLTLNPNHIASGINHHILIFRRTSDADSDEVLSAPLIHTGNHIGTKIVDLVFRIGSYGFPGNAAENGGDSISISAETGMEAVVVVSVSNRREFIAVEKAKSVFRFVGEMGVVEIGKSAGEGERRL